MTTVCCVVPVYLPIHALDLQVLWNVQDRVHAQVRLVAMVRVRAHARPDAMVRVHDRIQDILGIPGSMEGRGRPDRMAGSMDMDRKGNRDIDREYQDLLGFEALFSGNDSRPCTSFYQMVTSFYVGSGRRALI